MTDRETEIRRLKQLRQQKARELHTIEARLAAMGERLEPPREDWDGVVYGSEPALETR